MVMQRTASPAPASPRSRKRAIPPRASSTRARPRTETTARLAMTARWMLGRLEEGTGARVLSRDALAARARASVQDVEDQFNDAADL
mmetsp:Transcript_6044/g.24007  ORF Transcript_6044/g.24007 Transcript_6044/m.24007 type:complete len:87 (-) Transcript_6044:1211-1471(-)